MELEYQWDTALGIQTCGREDAHADDYHHPYEPTPYCVLERLVDSGLIGREDVVLDYGCGKGRVGFFLSYRTGAATIGIEYDPAIYEGAVRNRASARHGDRTEFRCARAEEYEVPETVTRCYFFNPFSEEILHGVLARLLQSWYESPRELFLFFYYPAREYLSCLMAVQELEFYDEIECDDLFEGYDLRERILIFRLPDYTME